MQPWLTDAQINRDRNLRLQYLAGRGLNLYHADTIYAEMLPYAKDPQGIFTGSDDLKQELLQKIQAAWNRKLDPCRCVSAGCVGAWCGAECECGVRSVE